MWRRGCMIESQFLVAEYYPQCFYCSNIIYYIYNLLTYRLIMHQMPVRFICNTSNENHSGYPTFKTWKRGRGRIQSKNGIMWDFWVLVKNTPRNQDNIHVTPVSFIYMKLFLDCAFMSLLDIESRSEFTSANSFQLANVIYLYDSIEKCAFATCCLVFDCLYSSDFS